MNKKGFTLVELLAVIVIMAILAVITTPIVINIISNSKENANKRSIENYAKSVESAYLQAKMDKKSINTLGDLIEGGYLKTSGDEVSCNIEVGLFEDSNNRDTIRLTDCFVKGSDGNQKSKYKYNYINGKLEKITDDNENTNNNETYEIGEEVIVKEEKYNVIGQGNDYVTLLKQQPLTTNEINNNKIGSDGVNHVNRYTLSSIGTAYDWGGTAHIVGLAYYSSPTCGYSVTNNIESWNNSGCTIDYNNSDIKYVLDNWAIAKFSNEYLKEVEGYKVRLPQKEELQPILWPNCSFNAEICSKESLESNWLYTSVYEYYWTMSQWNNSASDVWCVGGDGYLRHYYVQNKSGSVRPVINVYKSKVERVN